MTLEEKVMKGLVESMKSKNQDRLAALRAIKSELLLLKTSNQALSPETEVKMLQKMVKQRRESADIYKAQGREDLASVENTQAAVISEFLPAQLSAEDLAIELKRIIAATGATSLGDLGKVMAAASRELSGKADGKSISMKVKELLS